MGHYVLWVHLSRRHLAKVSQQGDGDASLTELAQEMRDWEIEANLARPAGAVFRVPKKMGKQSIANYLRRMGISHHRCAIIIPLTGL